MQPCLIVGVSNGGDARLTEYLPDYTHCPNPMRPVTARRKRRWGEERDHSPEVMGQADRTLAYYRDEVAAYVNSHFRTLTGREHTATCGSSMGGLFSAYIGWEYPDFARHHAIMSASFWITDTTPERRGGPYARPSNAFATASRVTCACGWTAARVTTACRWRARRRGRCGRTAMRRARIFATVWIRGRRTTKRRGRRGWIWSLCFYFQAMSIVRRESALLASAWAAASARAGARPAPPTSRRASPARRQRRARQRGARAAADSAGRCTWAAPSTARRACPPPPAPRRSVAIEFRQSRPGGCGRCAGSRRGRER